MGAIRILIADKDVEYGRALARAVSNIHNEFEITMVNLESQVKKKNVVSIDFLSFDLILISGYPDEILESIRKKLTDSRRIVILTDHQVNTLLKQTEEEENPFWKLYKYTEASLIISDLNYLISILTGKKSLLKKNTAPELIGFYSISGGTGKTVIALSTARELARYHDKRILYLSFDEIPATELLFPCSPKNRNIGDYLYFLFEKKNELLCSRLESFTIGDEYGVETIATTGGRNDLSELTQEELIQFLKVISDSCRYDYIALDLKSDLSDHTLFLLRLCSRGIVVQNDDPVSRYKTSRLEACFNTPDMENIKGRLILITNNAAGTETGGIGCESYNFQYQESISIERDENSFRNVGSRMDIDITHAFGIGIGKIADGILSSEKERKICTVNSVR